MGNIKGSQNEENSQKKYDIVIEVYYRNIIESHL